MNDQKDRLFQLSLLALLAFYGMVVNIANVTGTNLLPQFDIGQFNASRQPNESGYALQFTEIDGELQETPVDFRDAATPLSLLVEEMRGGGDLVTQMGIALYAEDSAEVESLRHEFEDRFLNEVESAEYQVILRVAYPVERYNWESDIAEQIMATFQFEKVPQIGQVPIDSR